MCQTDYNSVIQKGHGDLCLNSKTSNSFVTEKGDRFSIN